MSTPRLTGNVNNVFFAAVEADIRRRRKSNNNLNQLDHTLRNMTSFFDSSNYQDITDSKQQDKPSFRSTASPLNHTSRGNMRAKQWLDKRKSGHSVIDAQRKNGRQNFTTREYD